MEEGALSCESLAGMIKKNLINKYAHCQKAGKEMNISCSQTHFQNKLTRMCFSACHRRQTWKRRVQVHQRCSTLDSACSARSMSRHCNCSLCQSLSWTSIRVWLLARLLTFPPCLTATAEHTLLTSQHHQVSLQCLPLQLRFVLYVHDLFTRTVHTKLNPVT